ncbi:MAG: CehA/McbA family metallohydrolase [Verrucomicrobiota bacterium]
MSRYLLVLSGFLAPLVASAELVHLRGGGEQREWHSFPGASPAASVVLELPGMPGVREACLSLRQVDVRHNWNVRVNGHPLGRLQREEDRLIQLFELKPGFVSEERNRVEITFDKGRDVDDILVGDAMIYRQSRKVLCSAASLDLSVTENGSRVPARFTLVDADGCLVPLGLTSSDQLAVRTGVVYTLDGKAHVPCPAGDYTIYATRGFEYSLAKARVHLDPGDHKSVALVIEREVHTPDLVSCDPHVHTVTYSRHGDCSLTERIITLAGEHIECPVATDHNLHIDYRKEQTRLGYAGFKSAVGNEYTTSTGHFNLFPVDPEQKPPSYIGDDWQKVMASIAATGAPVTILNHARDIHRNYRPFDPVRHIAVTGESVDGLEYHFNAMEVLNSGAIISDRLLLVNDWFGLLNRGLSVAAIGSSDSHDVSNYIVGQGRTYVSVPDGDPGAWDVGDVVKGIQQGRTHLAYGLLVTLRAEVRDDGIALDVQVRGPSWIAGGELQLFMNGIEVFRADANEVGVIKFGRQVLLPNPGYDVWFAAVATGPGITDNYWPCAKPYQRLTERHEAYFLGLSPAVRVDANGDGAWQSAFAHARDLVKQYPDSPEDALRSCARYDTAVAAQLASVLVRNGVDPDSLQSDVASVKEGLRQFVDAWKVAQAAQTDKARFPAN